MHVSVCEASAMRMMCVTVIRLSSHQQCVFHADKHLMLVHAGSQDQGLGTRSRYVAQTISWNA